MASHLRTPLIGQLILHHHQSDETPGPRSLLYAIRNPWLSSVVFFNMEEAVHAQIRIPCCNWWPLCRYASPPTLQTLTLFRFLIGGLFEVMEI